MRLCYYSNKPKLENLIGCYHSTVLNKKPRKSLRPQVSFLNKHWTYRFSIFFLVGNIVPELKNCHFHSLLIFLKQLDDKYSSAVVVLRVSSSPSRWGGDASRPRVSMPNRRVFNAHLFISRLSSFYQWFSACYQFPVF